jgi:16S rRNA (cytosine967-C5)-methyltransferase
LSKPTGERARPLRQKSPHARPTAKQAPATIAPARVAAFEILTLVAAGKGHSDELLHSPRTDSLTPEDRNLTTALVMGVLRWQIALDARLAKLLARPDQRLAEPVALSLRMGAFQLLHMDRIPPHAVLNESVELCRAAGHPHAAGMVNAILRKLAAAQKPGQRIFESPAAFAERLGHPLWLVERWVAAYGRDAALAICEYDQREPQDGSLFADPPEAAPATSLPQMDDGSRLVAELASAALTVPHHSRLWDCCAAPGGKALILASRLSDTDILATDVSNKRLAQMQARLRRYSYAERVRFEAKDASNPAFESGTQFDLILCDVPCSGTGTLARNPEIRHQLRVEDLARQATRQRAILRSALQHLAPGGRLIYSTCSLEPEENEHVIQTIASEAGVHRVPIEPLLAKLGASNILRPESATTLLNSAVKDNALRTLPGTHPCDGFYAVVLQRN